MQGEGELRKEVDGGMHKAGLRGCEVTCETGAEGSSRGVAGERTVVGENLGRALNPKLGS